MVDGLPAFGFGQDVWPGLAKLAEECGELQQVIGKLIAMGGVVTHFDGTMLDIRLVEEMADVEAAKAFVLKYNPILRQALYTQRALDKGFQFQRWHRGET